MPRRLRATVLRAARSRFEPYSHDGIIMLANCPFDALSREHPDLVCGMNLDLMRGMLDACGSGDLHARLDPAPGRCCVTLDGRRA
jgi:predicted ArsR family transcriptional regulator